MREPRRRAGRRGGLWHHRDFRRLWIGDTVSQFGVMVGQLALPLVAILAVDASTFEVGLLTTFETLAFLLVGLPAGAWVDRMRHRRVMIVNDVIRAVALATIPAAQLADVLTIEQLYAVALVVGTSTVFFDVTYQSFLPALVDREHLVEGNAKLQASQSVSQVAAPSLGGALIQVITAPYAVLVTALSFLWSASWLTAIRTRPPKPERRPDRHLGREISEGVAFVFGNRLLRSIAACTGTSNLFSSMGTGLALLLLARELHLSPGVIGLITSTAAIGGLLGALLASRFARRVGQGPAIWLSTACTAPLTFVLPFVHRDWTLALYALAELGWFAGAVVYNITQVSFRQSLCPPHLLGRMNATMRFFVWGTMPLGGVLGGLIGSWLGVRPALLVVAVGASLAFLPVFLSPLRTMRELPVYVPNGETVSPPVESRG
ncbi:MFS transporter [Jatrophihabitans fulvus]